MLPIFPTLKSLELSDKDDVNLIVKKYPPYSDFNFVSLWSWNIHNTAKIGLLNGNLVLFFQDYISNEKFLSFLGETKVNETAEILLSASSSLGAVTELRLMPEHSITNLDMQKFNLHEDPSNHDYVSSVKELSEMKGSRFLSKRNYVNRFSREHGETVTFRKLNLADQRIKNEIRILFKQWQKSKGKDNSETENEFKAINRLLEGSHTFDLHAVGLYKDTALIAFAIHEYVQHDYAVFHFEKADAGYVGIFEFCKKHISSSLLTGGAVFMNLEQDLGLEGLRKAKESYRPIHYLKKYTVSKKT